MHIILSLNITYDSPLTEAFIYFFTRPYILLSIHSLVCSLAYSPIGSLFHPFILSIYSQSRLFLNNLVHVFTHIFILRRILSLRSPQQCPSLIRWEALSFAKASLNSPWSSCTQWHISIVMEIRHVVQFVNSSWKSRLSPALVAWKASSVWKYWQEIVRFLAAPSTAASSPSRWERCWSCKTVTSSCSGEHCDDFTLIRCHSHATSDISLLDKECF